MLPQNLARAAIASCDVLVLVCGMGAPPQAAAALAAAAARTRPVVRVGPARAGSSAHDRAPYIAAGVAEVCAALHAGSGE